MIKTSFFIFLVIIFNVFIICFNVWDGGVPINYVKNLDSYAYRSSSYGIHDHIARGAIYILIEKDSYNYINTLVKKNNWCWLKNFEDYFLFGTEVPDTGTQRGFIEGIDISNDNRPYHNKFRDVAKHHLYFENGKELLPRSYSAALRALQIADEVRWAIRKGMCKYAAYLLGAMSHYISDPTSYWHTGDKRTNRSYDQIQNHQKFEKSADNKVKYNYSPSKGIFEFKSLLDNLDYIEALNPIDATIYAAWDTYWDPDYFNDYPDNKGLYNHHWMNLIGQHKVNPIKVWERAKRSIHIAMLYSAKAIKWTIENNFKDCKDTKFTISKIKWNEIKRTPLALFTSKYSFRKMVFAFKNYSNNK
ncbi:MAG: zinc dependent phospholipase C family protein [Promethearchaeota archaeon]